MNLIEKWKNRETKRRLREENIVLRARNKSLDEYICMLSSRPSNVCTIDRNVQRVVARKVVPRGMYAQGYPEEQIKYDLRRILIDQVIPFVEYDFSSDKEMSHVYTATLYIATGVQEVEK